MKSIIISLLLLSHAVAYSQNIKEYESGSRTGVNYYRVDDKYDKLNKLKELYDSKVLTEDEFTKEKEKILSTDYQLRVQSFDTDMKEDIRESKKYRLTPGQHLQKAAKCYYAGMGFSVLAVIPLVLPDFLEGTTDKITETTVRNRNANYAAGAILGLAGIAFYLTGIGHIQSAGEKLEITASQNSIGMVFKF